MPRVIWQGHVVAEAAATVVVEGNHYFPPDSVDRHFFRDSSTTTRCPWKGLASYLDLVSDDAASPDAAWYYPAPEPAAADIAGHIAFYGGRDAVIED